jgi:hypothetical protein
MHEGYPRPQGPYSGGSYSKPSNGTLVLVLGILSLVCCGLLGPVAWIVGNQSLAEIRSGYMDPREEGLIVAGRVLGIISTALMGLAILFYGGLFALGLAAGGFS